MQATSNECLMARIVLESPQSPKDSSVLGVNPHPFRQMKAAKDCILRRKWGRTG